MHLKLKKGHNFKLPNHPAKEIAEFKDAQKIVISPLDYPYIKPKLLIQKDNEVKVGTPIFFDKINLDTKFVSPVSGKVLDIVYGERRLVESIVIHNDCKYETLELNLENSDDSTSLSEIQKPLDANSWIKGLKESGVWPMIRQRPFSKIADSNCPPKSIFISLFDTRPYGCSPEVVISSNNDLFNKGLKLLGKISDCPINITIPGDFDLDLISIGNQRSCQIHTVEGPHPAGNVGVQIHHINPILSKDDVRWYLDVNALIDLGYYFENLNYNPYKIISVCGAIGTPNYRKIVKNQSIEDVLSNDDVNINQYRIISGDMLSGSEKNFSDGVNPYDDMLTILYIDDEREFLGWINPGFQKYSLSNTFFSKLFQNLNVDISSRLNGDRRSIISFGRWEKVLPMDIMAEALVKSILIEDLESMENLGIYECAEEDFALCSYVCQSKTEVSQIIRKGVELAALDE